jgi:hypothetical protein
MIKKYQGVKVEEIQAQAAKIGLSGLGTRVPGFSLLDRVRL